MATEILTGSPAEVVESGKFFVTDNNPVTLIMQGSPGANNIALEITPDDGTTWIAYDEGGSPFEFSLTNRVKGLHYPGTYRVNKDGTTTSAITVTLVTSKSP